MINQIEILVLLSISLSLNYSFGQQIKGEFTDIRDEEVYKWIEIGNQIWMTENLRYKFGEYSEPDNWKYLMDNDNNAAYSYSYNNEEFENYGIYYTYAAAIKACPDGWHLPNDNEWSELADYLIKNGFNYDKTTSGNKIAKSLSSKSNWESTSGSGRPGDKLVKNNKSGFNAQPGGCLRYKVNEIYHDKKLGILAMMLYFVPLLNMEIMAHGLGTLAEIGIV